MNQRLSDEITSVLSKVKIVDNLARKKFIGLFILGLIKSRNVQFCEIAHHLNNEAKLSSNETRIQDFFREVELNYEQVAILLICLLPPKQKVRLCIDRTEWDFGKTQVNILMIIAGCGDFQVPLYWELLDNKSGNSSTEDRKNLVELCIKLLGKNRIGYVVGDREFIGHKWFKYLKDNGINFVMRLPKHHTIQYFNGHISRIEDLDLSLETPLILENCLVDGVVGNIWVKRLPDQDFLYLFGTVNSEFMGQLYRKRWTIETTFQGMKGRGFDLEKTHLQSLDKLKMLVALVSIAYGLCRSMGVYHHKKVQKIRNKKHGYKSKSFIRKGIDLIRQYFRSENNMTPPIENTIVKLLRWIRIQIPHFQLIKIAG